MAETTGLLNRRTLIGYRGFESRPLRLKLAMLLAFFDQFFVFNDVFEVWRSPVSAPALGAGGRRFESCHLDNDFSRTHGFSTEKMLACFASVRQFSPRFSATTGPIAQLDRAAAF